MARAAERGRSWTRGLAALAMAIVMAAGAGVVASAQSPAAQSLADGPAGTLTGKLTDLHSKPLEDVTVVVRNQSTGAEAHTTTTKNGSYRFTGLAAGEYTLEAESVSVGQGRLEDIFVAAGHETRVQTAMNFAPTPIAPLPVNLIRAASLDIEPKTPVVSATFKTRPPQTFPLHARHWLELQRAGPESSTPIMSAELATEPLQTLPLRGYGLPPFAVQGPVAAAAARTVSPATTATVSAALGAASGAVVRSALKQETPVAASAGGSTLTVGTAASGETAATGSESKPAQSRRTTQLATVEKRDPVAPVVTTTVSADELQALPVSGRRWQDFMLDAPTSATSAGGSSQTALRGAGQEPVATTMDGVSLGLAFNGTGNSGTGSKGAESSDQGGSGESGMGQSWAGGHGVAISAASISEVQTVVGNAGVAANRAAGGSMNVTSLRGGQGLHGRGFFFDRQNVWGAQNPFTQWIKETSPATSTTVPVFTPEHYTPPDHETYWGIGLGRQLRRNKLFWFASLDNTQRNDPGLSTVRDSSEFFAQPSNDQMQVLAARLGLSSSSPVTEGLAAYSCMLETLAGAMGGADSACPAGWPLEGLLGPAQRTSSQWTGFGRLDWAAAERHQFTLEGNVARENSPGGGISGVSERYGNHSFGVKQDSQFWLLGRWEAFITSNLLAMTQVSVGREIRQARPGAPSAYEQTLLPPSIWGQLPQIVIDNRYGFTIGNPSRFGKGSYPDEHSYQMRQTVDWVHGNLLLKVGFDMSHNADVTRPLRNQTGTYNYSSVENFASDALVFRAFGIAGEFDPTTNRNCDQTGKVWTDSSGNLRGQGILPCYSYYSQTLGPSDWRLSTSNWAGYATAQWQANKLLVLSAGLRWEREQLPSPIAALDNPGLPLTERLPNLGNNWGPRLGLALGSGKDHWPVLRAGYGIYFGRVGNATVETALTQTGSLNGDLNYFLRPTDNLNAGGAPPFPYVLAGKPGSAVKPGAVEFAPVFHNSEVHQAVVAVEESLPGRITLTASAVMSLGRRLPISIDTNFDPTVNPGTITYNVCEPTATGLCALTGRGPIKSPQITVPFYASWPSSTGYAGRLNPNYQQISQIMSRANSTYEAFMLKVSRSCGRGLNFRAYYTYAHAMDWNPNESSQVAGSDLLDPSNFSLEYGTSNLDIRHSVAGAVTYESPWKLHHWAGRLGNGWMLSGIGQFHSGRPYTMHTTGTLAREFTSSGDLIMGLAPGMNGSGGDNRVYGLGSDKITYNIGRNTYRYPSTWKADLRLAKRFDMGHMRQLELLAETFNLFNHQNVTELETNGYYIESGSTTSPNPTLNYLTGLTANSTAFGQPLSINANNHYRERQIQFGMRIKF